MNFMLGKVFVNIKTVLQNKLHTVSVLTKLFLLSILCTIPLAIVLYE